ncbi:MAG: hypothetical protein HQL52_05510 [Magnetococcales bacterium]|nr:hypothetical protein [Magnetococcales bacterium]
MKTLHTGSATLSYLLGGGIVLLAATTMVSSMGVAEITGWLQRVFGSLFIVLMATLIFITLFCWVRILPTSEEARNDQVWVEAGLQAANGITTLALTYTLLGISLGIGSLAGQELTPQTVQGIISELTDHFSMAFMTTVVGLPVSAVLRALLMVTHAHNQRHFRVPQEARQGELS